MEDPRSDELHRGSADGACRDSGGRLKSADARRGAHTAKGRVAEGGVAEECNAALAPDRRTDLTDGGEVQRRTLVEFGEDARGRTPHVGERLPQDGDLIGRPKGVERRRRCPSGE
jgi:hypothetical protein